MQNSPSRCKHQCRFCEGPSLYSLSLMPTVMIRRGSLDTEAVFDKQAMPGMMQTVSVMYDAIAAKCPGEIERLVSPAAEAETVMATWQPSARTGHSASLARTESTRSNRSSNTSPVTMTPNSSPPSGATIDPPVEGGSKKVRDGHDDIIAAGMAETIGNCLEAVDIEAHQRCVAIDPLQRLGEGSPVEKTGRHVRPAKLLELRARQGELMQSITGDQAERPKPRRRSARKE